MPGKAPSGEPAPSDGSLSASALAELGAPLSVYVHVPFCRTRCGYCDFNTYTPQELGGLQITDYLAAAEAEIKLAERILGASHPPVSTVFFGGGTPTMLRPKQLGQLIVALRERLGVAADAEITIEANPETLDEAYLAELRELGCTRISLGIQSVVGRVLGILDRVHTPERGLQAAQWAREAGFDHISCDLIFGTPGESCEEWETSLRAVAQAPVDHVSAYSLIVEEGTRLAHRIRRGELAMPDEDDLADKYALAEQHLVAAGFANYETSNWAKPGGECQHNLAYWRGVNWWGFGPGAHSHIGGVRFWNRRHPASYAKALSQGDSPVQAREVLTPEQRRTERVMLGLRLAAGIPLTELTSSELARLPRFQERGVLALAENRCWLTPEGRLLADGIVAELLD